MNLKEQLLINLIILLIILTPWVINFNKLSNCDFDSPYKCEVIHAIGIIPLASFITVWFEDDSVTEIKGE